MEVLNMYNQVLPDKKPEAKSLPISGTYIHVLPRAIPLTDVRGSDISQAPSIGKRRAWGFLFLALWLNFFSCAYALSPTEEARFASLTREIRCVVCQNQSIADSSAPLANDLRNKVYAMVEQQKSDDEIKDYLAARYGEFILLKPRQGVLTLFLWLFPTLCLGLLGYIFIKSKKH